MTFVVVFWKKSLSTTTFLISFFISHSLFHFFSKMSLTHIDAATPCLWVVIDLFDPSFFHFLLKCWVEHCTAHKTLWKQVNTVVVIHSLQCVLYHPVQHVNSSTRPSYYSSISHSFDHAVGSIVCCCNSNPLSRKSSSSNTLKHSFHINITTSSKQVQFCKW